MNPILGTIIFITYLGNASFLIEHGNMRILTDPGDFFTNRLTVEKAQSLQGIDLILVSHADFDHTNRLEFIPDIERIPIVSTPEVKRKYPSLQVIADKEYSFPGVRITAINSIHGVRHDIDHRSFLIRIKDLTILFLGDAYKLSEKIELKPDLLFITVGGFEANPENALTLAGELDPAFVIPMHWEVFFRSDSNARRLCDAVSQGNSGIRCFIPQYDVKLKVIKSDRITIE